MRLQGFAVSLVLLTYSAAPGIAQDAALKTEDKAAAYYNYSLGHLYAELAATYGNRGDYLSKAIVHYKAAIKADPSATFISEELSDLYMQGGKIRDAVLEAEEALKQNPNDLVSRRILGRIYARLVGDPQQKGNNEEMLKRALEQYQKIAEKSPKDLDTQLMLGRLFKMSQNSVDSEKAFKKALEIDPENGDAMTGLAMVYMDVGDTNRASDLLKKVADKDPSMRNLETLAQAYEQMHEYSLASQVLKRALEQRGDNPDIKRQLANDLALAEQLDESLKLFKELAAEDPKDIGALLRMSQIYRTKRDFASAWEVARKAKELEPGNLELRFNEVNLYEAEGKFPEAITELKDILNGNARRSGGIDKANRAMLLERLGLLYRQNEQYRQAIDTFRQLADLDTAQAGRAYAQIVDTYRASKDYTKAIEESEAAVRKFPNDRTLRMVRASVLGDAGKADLAAEEVKKLLDGKNDRETYLSLAQIYEKGKNFGEMGKAIDSAEKLSESKEEKEGVYFTRGAMLEKMKKFDEAEAAFKKVLDLNPKNGSALNYLGYMLADRNIRLPEAQDMIQRALSLEPNNGAYLDSLGWVYYRLGKLSEAEETLKQAIERTGHDPTVRDHLGDVYAKAGKLKEAIAAWQESLKEYENAAPNEKDPAEIAKIKKKVDSATARAGGKVSQRK